MSGNVTTLQRKLARLQDKAERRLHANAPIVIITTCWSGEQDEDKRDPDVTYIITDWSNGGSLESED